MLDYTQYDIEEEDFPEKDTRRGLRRVRKKKKTKALIKNTSRRCIGFVWSDDTGKYIKRQKNSNAQRFLKKQSAKRWRRYGIAPTKGNYYRRLLDYRWELF